MEETNSTTTETINGSNGAPKSSTKGDSSETKLVNKMKNLEQENRELKEELANLKADYLKRFTVCDETQQYLMKDIELLYDKLDDLSLACGTIEVKLWRFSNILPVRVLRKVRKKLLGL